MRFKGKALCSVAAVLLLQASLLFVPCGADALILSPTCAPGKVCLSKTSSTLGNPGGIEWDLLLDNGASTISVSIYDANHALLDSGSFLVSEFADAASVASAIDIQGFGAPTQAFSMTTSGSGPSGSITAYEPPLWNRDPWSIGVNAGSYNFTLPVTFTPVPEPATVVLLGTGLLGLARARRKKG